MPEIKLEHIVKRWGKFYGVDDLNLVIKDNAFVTLLGPSSCGKTTTLRMIAGLETPTSGRITIGDRVVFDSERGINIPPNKRKVGFLFQNYALWPNMTVYQNIAFGLANIREPRKLTKAEIDKRVHEVAKVVKIGMFMDRYPSELSGGQQQRVAIARTLAPEPSVLFMDEPLSNLDAKLRLDMRYELQRLHVETGSTFVYVTHDQMEAMTLATQICLINNGVLQQYDAPLELYGRPNNLFTADFVGNPSINFVNAKVLTSTSDGALELEIFDGKKATFTPIEPLDLAAWDRARDDAAAARDAELAEKMRNGYVEKANKDEPFKYNIARIDEGDSDSDENDGTVPQKSVITDSDLVLGIRPEFVDIVNDSTLTGEIYGAMPTGMESTIKVRVDNFLLTGVVFGRTTFAIGSKVPLKFSGDNILLFDRKSGKIITSGTLEIK